MFKFKRKKSNEIGKGGDAGEVFIAARKMNFSGKIISDGGDGSVGGKGGKVTLISEDNKFSGDVSTKGGKSLSPHRRWYQTWWGIIILGTVGSAIVAGIFSFL